MEWEVYATRMICSLTKNEMRDEEIGEVYLPSNNTNCVKSYSKGRYYKVVDYAIREVDGMFWQEHMESFDVCS
jgi:hypothetical protein